MNLLHRIHKYISDTIEPLDRDGVVLWGCVFAAAFAATYGI